MKLQKIMVSILLVTTVLLSPISISASDDYTTHQTFILDGSYLTAITNNSPYFSAFIEKILIPYNLALYGHYAEAKEEFKSCIEYIKYEQEYFEGFNYSMIKSLSSNAKETMSIINFYMNVMFAQSEALLNTLAEYINCLQQPDKTDECKKLSSDFFNTRSELENNVYLFQYLKDSITKGYVYAYAHPDESAYNYNSYINKTIKEPVSNNYDPYGYYVKNKSELAQTYDFNKIVEIIIIELVEESEIEVSESENEIIEPKNESTDNTTEESDLTSAEIPEPVIETTTPINTAVAFMKVPKEDIYDDSAYKVGVDIPAGEYIVIPNIATSTYFRVTNSENEILANGFSDSSYYITVEDGQYFMIDDGFAIPANKYNVAVYNYSAIYPGMYKVGTDIPVGEYKFTTLESNGYYCLYDNSTTARKIVSNDYFSKSSYVNAKLGDYLLVDCIAEYIDPNVKLSTVPTKETSNETTPPTKNQDTNTQKQSVPSVVYWIPNGKVYHKSASCPTLDRSTNIKSGSIAQSGKASCCKVCG